jgi:hypothetical protein
MKVYQRKELGGPFSVSVLQLVLSRRDCIYLSRPYLVYVESVALDCIIRKMFDIAENCWIGVKQQSLTHSSVRDICVLCFVTLLTIWTLVNKQHTGSLKHFPDDAIKCYWFHIDQIWARKIYTVPPAQNQLQHWNGKWPTQFFSKTHMSRTLEWVSDCCLTPIQQFSAISWREQVNFQWDDDEVRFVLDQHAELVFIVLAHWNNSPRVDMLLHPDTLFWFRSNHFLLFLINAACLAEKQQIQML